MAVVSVMRLNKFMNCPYTGASGQGPLPTRVSPPVCTALPVIIGALRVGSTLATTNGTWTSSVDPVTFTYKWLRDGVLISGATEQTYVITAADIGSMIGVTVTAFNVGGGTSVAAAPVGLIGGLLNQHLPKVTGTFTVGSTVTTDNGGWVGAPPPTFAYSWQRDGVDIPGAMSTTYLLVSADVGHYITSRVIATNIAGSVSAYSSSMGPVASPVINTAPPVISGATIVGQTLVTTDGTWTGFPAPTLAYQWQRNGTDISGATANTYLLITADLGTMITAKVVGTNSAGSVNAISNSLGPIAAAPTIALSNSYIAKGVAIGTTVGALSVANGVGPYAYSLTSNPSGLFAISGSNLNVATVPVGGAYSITVQATGGTPSPVTQNFTINVAALILSGSSISANAALNAPIGSLGVNNSTGSYTYALTSSPSGQFAISGSTLIVASALTAGSYPITIQATGGVPAPISDSFMITVVVFVATTTFDPGSVSNTALSNSNLTATATAGGIVYPGAKSIAYQTSGKYYFEVLCGTVHGSQNAVGIINNATSFLTALNNATGCSMTISNSGSLWGNDTIGSGSIGAWGAGDRISVAIDLNARRTWFRKNGGLWNGNAGADPAAGTNGITVASAGVFAPFVGFNNGNGIGDTMTANFGATAYTYAMPSGFINWPSASVTIDRTISPSQAGAGSSVFIEDGTGKTRIV